MNRVRSFLLSSCAFALLCGAARAEWPVAPESLQRLRDCKINEKAEVWETKGKNAEEVKALVARNWRDLLLHLDDLPGYKESPHAITAVIGRAAESLPPQDYVDFLDAVAVQFADGKIPDNSMQLILDAPGKKRGFIPVNAKHARIQALGKRLRETVPAEKGKLRDLIERVFTGQGAEDYETVAYVPETLPGVSLPNTFMARAKRAMLEREREDLAKEKLEAKLTLEQKQERAAKVGSKARLYIGLLAIFLVVSLIYSAVKRR